MDTEENEKDQAKGVWEYAEDEADFFEGVYNQALSSFNSAEGTRDTAKSTRDTASSNLQSAQTQLSSAHSTYNSKQTSHNNALSEKQAAEAYYNRSTPRASKCIISRDCLSSWRD